VGTRVDKNKAIMMVLVKLRGISAVLQKTKTLFVILFSRHKDQSPTQEVKSPGQKKPQLRFSRVRFVS